MGRFLLTMNKEKQTCEDEKYNWNGYSALKNK